MQQCSRSGSELNFLLINRSYVVSRKQKQRSSGLPARVSQWRLCYLVLQHRQPPHEEFSICGGIVQYHSLLVTMFCAFNLKLTLANF